MGVVVEKLGTGSYRFQAKSVNLEFFLDPDYKRLGGSLRGSVMVAGPALARFGRGYIPSPGGDKIGRRRMAPGDAPGGEGPAEMGRGAGVRASHGAAARAWRRRGGFSPGVRAISIHKAKSSKLSTGPSFYVRHF